MLSRPSACVGRRVLTRQVGLGQDDGERGAQLVRDLVGQPAFGGERLDDPVEHLVEGAAEVRDLVAARARGRSGGRVVLAPVVGEVGHRLHLSQRAGRRHPGRAGRDRDRGQPEADREPERVRSARLVGLVVLGRHDRRHPLAVSRVPAGE